MSEGKTPSRGDVVKPDLPGSIAAFEKEAQIVIEKISHQNKLYEKE